MRIGIVTGLAAEAGCLGRAGGEGLRVRCIGARTGAAGRAAEALVEEGCRGLVSFGTAGGLDPRLPPGTLVLAEAVILPDGARIAVDAGWHERLNARLNGRMPLVSGAIAAADDPLLTPEAKAACRRATGAVAVDMESGAVARAAVGGLAERAEPHLLSSWPGLSRPSIDPRDQPGRDDNLGNGAHRAGVPFIIIRAIADPADRTVPAWVMQAVTADGRTALAPVLSHLARNPGDLPALARLALDARAAMRSLRRVATLAGPLLAFDR